MDVEITTKKYGCRSGYKMQCICIHMVSNLFLDVAYQVAKRSEGMHNVLCPTYLIKWPAYCSGSDTMCSAYPNEHSEPDMMVWRRAEPNDCRAVEEAGFTFALASWSVQSPGQFHKE